MLFINRENNIPNVKNVENRDLNFDYSNTDILSNQLSELSVNQNSEW